MLYFVNHRLGDLRKSAREVGASRLFCFNAGFSGSPNGVSFRLADSVQFLCISQLKLRLTRIANSLPFVETNPTPSRTEILDRLQRGEINAQDAIRELEESL
jgi:hypothetical protein